MHKDDKEMMTTIFWWIVTFLGGVGIGLAVILLAIGGAVWVLTKMLGN